MPSSFVPLIDNHTVLSDPFLSTPFSADFVSEGFRDPAFYIDFNQPEQASDQTLSSLDPDCFAHTRAWHIDRFLQVHWSPSSISCIKRLVKTARGWLSEWVEKGNNPFIHSQLYRFRRPRCIEAAYTALTCYLHKIDSNEQIIFQILENQAKVLVESRVSSGADLDLLEHIARVQALIVHQFIGLYDGDVRLRQVAESHIPVLNCWLEQLVQNASSTTNPGRCVTATTSDQHNTAAASQDDAVDGLSWHSWILAESIRRTWLVGSGIQGSYLTIQQNKSVPCLGGMVLTTCRGIWESQSASEWRRRWTDANCKFIQVAKADQLFNCAAPDEVDRFVKLVLEATFGEERFALWRAQAWN
ncbi:MAG: hypothetical protein Q9227_001765 [Pyrenula ochraceoflavens]